MLLASDFLSAYHGGTSLGPGYGLGRKIYVEGRFLVVKRWEICWYGGILLWHIENGKDRSKDDGDMRYF